MRIRKERAMASININGEKIAVMGRFPIEGGQALDFTVILAISQDLPFAAGALS